jgi:glutathione peroxidase
MATNTRQCAAHARKSAYTRRMTALQQIPVNTLQGQPSSLEAFAGKVVLVVNVASKCGLTPQYTALQKLYDTYKDAGLVVVGVPSNDFGGQEPGTSEEIAQFCSTNYAVSFPLFEKLRVVGADKHPLYAALTSAQPEATGDKPAFRTNLVKYGITPNEDPEVLWNFEKFLVGKNGEVIARFAPTITPEDPALVSTIESALKN